MSILMLIGHILVNIRPISNRAYSFFRYYFKLCYDAVLSFVVRMWSKKEVPPEKSVVGGVVVDTIGTGGETPADGGKKPEGFWGQVWWWICKGWKWVCSGCRRFWKFIRSIELFDTYNEWRNAQKICEALAKKALADKAAAEKAAAEKAKVGQINSEVGETPTPGEGVSVVVAKPEETAIVPVVDTDTKKAGVEEIKAVVLVAEADVNKDSVKNSKAIVLVAEVDTKKGVVEETTTVPVVKSKKGKSVETVVVPAAKAAKPKKGKLVETVAAPEVKIKKPRKSKKDPKGSGGVVGG